MTLEELNLNKFLYRIQTDENGDSLISSKDFKSLNETSSESIVSGEIDGNLAFIGGFIRSKNFVSGSAGWQIEADGDAEFASITLTGGTINYGKTSFTDSTNAGWILSPSGVYFGSASDATAMKYTVATGVITFTGALDTPTGNVGNWTIGASSLSSGSISLNSTAETILIGAATAPLTGIGVFLGKDGSDYEFRVGDPAGDYTHWDGSKWIENLVEMPTDANLLGKWSFDEGTGTTAYDESGNGNNGTITGGTYVIGVSGQALDFTGATALGGVNYGNVLNNIFAGGGYVSIRTNPDGAGGVEVLMDKGRNFGDGWSLALEDLAGGNYALYFRHSGTVASGTWKTGVVIPANSWTHVIVSYNKDSASNDPVFYINGNSVTVTEVDTPSGEMDSDTGRPLIIGNYEVVDTPYDGTLDEPRLYSGTISARNARGLFKNPSGTKMSTNVLNVSRLIAGTISSQAITLGITAGVGDAKIQAGKTDFGQDATNGFIIGLDDSDSDLAKFEMGSSASKMFKYDGTDVSLTGGIITAGTIRTSASAARVELTATGDDLNLYDSSGNSLFLLNDSSTNVVKFVPRATGQTFLVQNISTLAYGSGNMVDIDMINSSSTGIALRAQNAGSGDSASFVALGTGIPLRLTSNSSNALMVVHPSQSPANAAIFINNDSDGASIEIDQDVDSANNTGAITINYANVGAGTGCAFDLSGDTVDMTATGVATVTGVVKIVTSEGIRYIPIYTSYS